MPICLQAACWTPQGEACSRTCAIAAKAGREVAGIPGGLIASIGHSFLQVLHLCLPPLCPPGGHKAALKHTAENVQPRGVQQHAIREPHRALYAV